ncbi:hypothetical protein OSTOST_03719, partial [Ostertagia ostertagi]
TLLNSYIGGVFPSWGWFTVVYSKLGKPYAYVYLFIVWGSGINQALSVSMLAANRLSAIIFPQGYHKLWSGQRLKIAVAMQIVPGYTVPLVILSNDVGFETTDYGDYKPSAEEMEEIGRHYVFDVYVITGSQKLGNALKNSETT